MSSVERKLNVDNCCSPKASTYDRFSAGLVASIVICGFLVLSLAVIWLFGSKQQAYGLPPTLDPIQIENPDDHSGLEQELDEVVGGSNSTELVSLLESIENSVSTKSAGSPGDGKYLPGTPDDRDPGPDGTVPKTSKWKVSFEVENIEQYKSQLDFFGIEIGVVASKKDDIWRVAKLSSGAKVIPSNRLKEKSSYYFTHSKPTLKRWDKRIAEEAGIAAEDRIFVQFYPAELIGKIASLEAEKLKELGRELEEVEKTNIRFSKSDGQFSVSITDFEFR